MNAFNQIISSDLTRLDMKIEDEDKTCIVLCSLPFSYEHLVTNLTYMERLNQFGSNTGCTYVSLSTETECNG